MKVALAAAVALAFNLLPASGFDDGVSLLSVVLQNRSKKVQLPPTEGTEGAGPILIPLTRLRGNATGASWRNSSYVGELFLGRPQLQRLTVTFDTASGQVILPSSRCRSLACLEHQRYAPRASTSSREINADGSQVRVPAGARTIRRDAITVGVTSIDHGSGRAYGDLIYDRLCFGGVARKAQCASLGFVGVTNMSDAPFRDMLQDGLVGLGLAQLAANPIFHVLSRLDLPSGMARRFGVFLQADGGELSIGGLNPTRLQGGDPTQLNWAPVHQPEDGYWQFALAGLRIGNRTISCGPNCRGIVDTSAAGLGLPSSLHATLQSTLGAAVCSGPDIYFDVKAADSTPAFSLKLTAKEYRSQDCQAMITATDLPEAFADVLILGQPLLRKYYSIFDWETRSIGFGVAAEAAEAPSKVGISHALKDEDGVELPILSTLEAEALEEEVLRREVLAADPEFTVGGMSMQAHALSVLLLQVLIMQVVVIFILIAFGGPRGSQESLRARLLFSPLGVALQCWFGVSLPPNSQLSNWLIAIRPVPAAEAPEASECVVCLGVREEDLKPGCCRPKWCKLRCGHAFHQECISQWLPKVAQCPVCRSNIFDGKRQSPAPPPARSEGAP